MAGNGTSLAPMEFWGRIQDRVISRFPEFRREAAVAPPGGRAPSGPDSLVGPASGRIWEVRFLAPKLLSPDIQVGFTTAVRLVDPPAMPHYAIPFLYVGLRPGVFTRGSVGTDRIFEKYKSGGGPRHGAGTGDAEFDRRWVVYTHDTGLAAVFRQPEVLRVLRRAAALSPAPNGDLPTLAVLGTEATVTLPTAARSDRVAGIVSALEGTSMVLDRLESARGLPPASQSPLPMDVLHDDTGVPFPLARFECPWCHEVTHPKFHPNFNTETCEKCGQVLYRFTK